MNTLYTVLAAIIVKYLVDGIKAIGGWLAPKIPSLPTWILNLVPLWKLTAAIGVTVLVVLVTKRFAIELQHPLVVLVLAQIAHEITSAVNKTRAES